MEFVSKSWLTRVSKNTFPKKKLGNEYAGSFGQSIQPTKEKDNNIIAVWVTLFANMFDKNKKELYRFETETYFEFTDSLDKDKTLEYVYHLYLEAIPDFNEEYKKLESETKFGGEFEKLSFDKLKPFIIQAFLTIYSTK